MSIVLQSMLYFVFMANASGTPSDKFFSQKQDAKQTRQQLHHVIMRAVSVQKHLLSFKWIV
jgi:hypothetical protein